MTRDILFPRSFPGIEFMKNKRYISLSYKEIFEFFLKKKEHKDGYESYFNPDLEVCRTALSSLRYWSDPLDVK